MQKLAQPALIAPKPKNAEPLVDKLICWDLDETLGRFYGIYARMHGFDCKRADGLKPGIREALAELSALGFSHVVTTAAQEDEATAALSQAGLLGSFLRIFHESKILRGNRKDYSVVAEAFGMGEGDFRKRAIVVGDIIPLDLPENGVFIHEPDAPCYSADITKSIIRLISEKGEGDFWAGFGALFSDASGAPMPGHQAIRIMGIAEGFRASLYYSNGSAIARITMDDARFRADIEPF
ncbi:HAD family hydrolase [Candidatus Micrarchaeota archaeon]|nr:HAD family hydrolase [Candidatus Micrarchaeota archaeon]